MHFLVAPTIGGCQGWSSSEAWLTEPLGFGTYLVQITGTFLYMDPQVTLGVFLWDDDCPDACNHREVDIEMGKWGIPGDPNSGQ